MMREIFQLTDRELRHCYYLVVKIWFAKPKYKMLLPIIQAYADELERRDLRF